MIYHYTVGDCLAEILDSGVLRLAYAANPFPKEHAVWFTRSEQWEETASKMIVQDGMIRGLNGQQSGELFGGLCRIGVDEEVAPHDWDSYKRISGITPRRARGLYNCSIAVGSSPRDWRVSFEPVPAFWFLTVERLDNGEWSPVTREDIEVSDIEGRDLSVAETLQCKAEGRFVD